MLFEGVVVVTKNATGVDPIATPEDVPPEQIAALHKRAPGCDVLGRRILLAFEAKAGETVTVSLYALDEGTRQQNRDQPDPTALRFYLIASAVVLTAGNLHEITSKVPPGGAVYVRQTADTIAAGTGTVRLTCVP